MVPRDESPMHRCRREKTMTMINAGWWCLFYCRFSVLLLLCRLVGSASALGAQNVRTRRLVVMDRQANGAPVFDFRDRGHHVCICWWQTQPNGVQIDAFARWMQISRITHSAREELSVEKSSVFIDELRPPQTGSASAKHNDAAFDCLLSSSSFAAASFYGWISADDRPGQCAERKHTRLRRTKNTWSPDRSSLYFSTLFTSLTHGFTLGLPENDKL